MNFIPTGTGSNDDDILVIFSNSLTWVLKWTLACSVVEEILYSEIHPWMNDKVTIASWSLIK